MFNDGGNPMVTGCTFDGNIATQSGGAMLNNYASSTVTDCVFTSNTALGDQSAGGGAIWTLIDTESEVSLISCNFSENQGFLGGAVCFASFESGVEPATISNCTFTNNTATIGVNGLGGIAGAVRFSTSLSCSSIQGMKSVKWPSLTKASTTSASQSGPFSTKA